MSKYIITKGIDFFLIMTHSLYVLGFAFLPFLGYEIYINKDINPLYIFIAIYVGFF